MSQINWNKLKDLMETDWIKDDIEEYLDGYYFNGNIEENDEKCIFFFNGDVEGNVQLIFKDGVIEIQKVKENTTELFLITDDNLTIDHHTIEKRDKGIIYTHLVKRFAPSSRSKKTVLVDLWEKRYTITNENLKMVVDEHNLDIELGVSYIEMFKELDKDKIKAYSDFNSEFSTHMKTYYPWSDGRVVTNVPGAVLAFLTAEKTSNVSRIYDLVDGPDKLYRVYDLYRGIINRRNEEDILSIHLGLLSEDSFDLKSLSGITEKEDRLIGKSKILLSEEYIEYLKQLLSEKYGYFDKITLDRNGILDVITNMPNFDVGEVGIDIENIFNEEMPMFLEKVQDEKNEEVSKNNFVRCLRKILKRFGIR